MTASPRQLARSTRLRALSVLAWLMLVVQAVPAMPTVPAASAMPASMSMGTAMHGDAAAASCDHATGRATAAPATPDHDSCCGGAASLHCRCAAMSAPALLPMPSLTVAANLLLARIAGRQAPSAPRPPALPPLRPPQA